MSELQLAGALQKVFGAACDPDPGGHQFMIDGPVCCPAYGSPRSDWAATDPPVLMEWQPVPVTHASWNAKDTAARMQTVARALQAYQP